MRKCHVRPSSIVLCIVFLLFLACDYVGTSDTVTSDENMISDSSGNSSGTTAQWPPAGFTESAADQHPAFPDTRASVMTVYAPLPDTFPEHPAACDNLRFLRIRHIDGPANPSDAEKILIAQPGVLEGASAFYNVACNMVTRAHDEKGKYIEFWAIDRRSNALEDLRGIEFARKTKDSHDFIDYYYRGKAYLGKKFEGFLNPYTDAKWLCGMGMDRTVRDWNEVITRGIPDQSVRQKKVFLGGHSLGGFITGAYACWDFDGDPETTADAGYNQCAGYFGLDTTVTANTLVATMSGSSIDLGTLLGKIPENVVAMMKAGYFTRFVSLPGIIDPEVMTLLSGLGAAANLWPDDESDSVDYLPHTVTTDLSFRVYHSRNLCAFLAPTASLRKIRYTNEALFAVFIDDNGQPISIIRSSAGFFGGGTMADKNFPLSESQTDALAGIEGLEALTAFFGGEKLAITTDDGTSSTEGPLYRWINYDEIDDAAVPLAHDGEPYTTLANEVTDMRDLSFSMGAYPLNFVEEYFPMRLAIESMLGTGGIVHKDGVSKHPVLDIVAGNGPDLAGDNKRPGTPVIPGYDHLDVLTAAAEQNDGKPEKVCTNLLKFVFDN